MSISIIQALEKFRDQPEQQEYDHAVLRLLNERFSTWDDLVRTGNPAANEEIQQKEEAEDGWGLDDDDEDDPIGESPKSIKTKAQETSPLTGLELEIAKWKEIQQSSSSSLAETNNQIRPIIEQARSQLQSLQSQTSLLSQSRYSLIDDLSRLTGQLISTPRNTTELTDPQDMDEVTLLEQLEKAQEELRSLGVGLKWIGVIEKIMLLAQETLEPSAQVAAGLRSPVLSIPKFKALHTFLVSLSSTLPPHLHILQLSLRVYRETWRELKRWGQESLEKAVREMKWGETGKGGVFDYAAVGQSERARFERSFKELGVLQHEGIKLVQQTPDQVKSILILDESIEDVFYPIETMVRAIRQRFVFHFEGDRPTNRLDKPEWAFSSILDTIYEQRPFAEDYLRQLVLRCGNQFKEVDAVSELTAQLLRLPLSLLKHRFPHLLPYPPLLAHTVYQTVTFDESVRHGGFAMPRTWKEVRRRQTRQESEAMDVDGAIQEWEGLTEEILNEGDWFEKWWQGEKEFATEQYEEITSSPDAWTLVNITDVVDAESNDKLERRKGFKPTIGARQVKALIEQVADRYAALPTLRHKYPFLAQVQLPILNAYRERIASSLDAFETLSSTFARAVPGALAGHARDSGLSMDAGKMTSGVTGLQRLTKAWISAEWMRQSMQKWGDELLYLNLVADILDDQQLRYRAQHDGIQVEDGGNPYGSILGLYQGLSHRAEGMIVKHVTAEVERDLRSHLTRRWVANARSVDKEAATVALIGPLTTLSAHLGHLARMLPAATLGRIYRAIVAHIINHIMQRAVYAGWSKFTEFGGQELQAETSAWIEASRLGLQEATFIRRPELPWQSFVETARVLALPVEPQEGQAISFTPAVAMAFDSQFGRLAELVDIKELDQGQVQIILRRRIDCWR